MVEKNRTQNSLLGILYWIVTFIIFALVANNDEKFAGEIRVFYISGTKWLIHLIFLAMFILVSIIFVKRIVIDSVEILLITKFAVDIISTCIINEPESFAFIVWADIGALSYLICRNSRLNLDVVLDLYEVFAIVLSIQTILTGRILQQNGILFESVIFKSLLRIPYAGSNLIADFISSALLCLLARYDSKRIKKSVFIVKLAVYIIAILFIRSRGSIVALLFVLDWTFLKRIKRINSGRRRIILYMFLALVNVIAIVYALNSTIVESYFSRYLDTSSDITSGRIQIWQFAWNEFLSHPILGRGILFTSDSFRQYTGAHNIWLDTLMGSGMIGFILHISCISILIKTIRKNKVIFNKTVFACSVVLGFLYIDSMFEVSYYNYINDVIFWSLCGCLISFMSQSGQFVNPIILQSTNS